MMCDNISDDPTSWLYSSHPTDDELYQIYTAHPTDGNLVKLFNDKKEDELFIFCDEAFGMYWNRKLKSLGRKLTQEEIGEILNHIEFPCAKGTLGEAAVLGLLSKGQCEELIRHFDAANWTYVQLKARILVSSLNDSMKADNMQANVLKVLEELLHLKRDLWAIEIVLDYMNSDELIKFKKRLLSEKSLLNKGNRHTLRERIDKILKK